MARLPAQVLPNACLSFWEVLSVRTSPLGDRPDGRMDGAMLLAFVALFGIAGSVGYLVMTAPFWSTFHVELPFGLGRSTEVVSLPGTTRLNATPVEVAQAPGRPAFRESAATPIPTEAPRPTPTVTVAPPIPAVVPPPPPPPPPQCQIVLGFADLRARIGPEIVGDCLEDEHVDPASGDTHQRTSHGLLVWRRVDRVLAYTDGTQTWLFGPRGLEKRPNDKRLPWEMTPTPTPRR